VSHPVLTCESAAPADRATRTTTLKVPTHMPADEPRIPHRERVFAELQPLVRRLVRQYGTTAELREDLPGVLYCRFCELLEDYDESRGIPLRPYLVRMLVTCAYTYSRKQWRREVRSTSLEAMEEARMPLAEMDPTGTWAQGLSVRDTLARLPLAISTLPPRQRQVVIWRYYESRSFEEIAALLGIREASARSLLRHGLNNLRQQFAEDEPPMS
jgi:RNA polymerase sigma factor (sigma-70 family)